MGSIQNSEHIVCHGRNFYLIVMLLCRSLEIYFPKTMHSSDVKLHYWLSNEIMLTGPDDDKNGKNECSFTKFVLRVVVTVFI